MLTLHVAAAQGYYTKDRPKNSLDVTVVEATEILEDGSIVPGASVGATPELVQMADKVRTAFSGAICGFYALCEDATGKLTKA